MTGRPSRLGQSETLWRRLVVVGLAATCLGAWAAAAAAAPAGSQAEVPELTRPVNDFARVIEPSAATEIDRMIRALERASGDAVVVATVDTIAPFSDIRDLAVKLFENQGRGIGRKGADNGVLVLLSVGDRKVWIEVGYGLEEFITDGFAGETSRQYMAPAFRRRDYGRGLQDGVARLVTRIAEARGVTLDGVSPPARRRRTGGGSLVPVAVLIVVLLLAALTRGSGPPRYRRGGWGGGGWSGWSSGIGSFGGGGFGGGFGGFGGGGSGGGGGGASW